MTEEKKVVLITGAGRGLGKATGVRFAASGYTVVITDVDPASAKQAAEDIGNGAVGWELDVRNPEQVEEVFRRVASELGRLDVLVNNAGLSRPTPTPEVTEEDWHNLVDICLGGTFRCSKFAYPLLLKSGGSVVNMSSGAGTIGHGDRASYAGSKAGVMGLTRDLAVEWAKDGIRVNAIAPGVFMTEMVRRNAREGIYDPTKMCAGIPMARFGEESEIADTVFFLAETATYFTGQVLHCDGGLSIGPHW